MTKIEYQRIFNTAEANLLRKGCSDPDERWKIEWKENFLEFKRSQSLKTIFKVEFHIFPKSLQAVSGSVIDDPQEFKLFEGESYPNILNDLIDFLLLKHPRAIGPKTLDYISSSTEEIAIHALCQQAGIKVSEIMYSTDFFLELCQAHKPGRHFEHSINKVLNRIANDEKPKKYFTNFEYSQAKSQYQKIKDQTSLSKLIQFYGRNQELRTCEACSKTEEESEYPISVGIHEKSELILLCRSCEVPHATMRFTVTDYLDWDHNIYEAAKVFRSKYDLYPNILLANESTLQTIDLFMSKKLLKSGIIKELKKLTVFETSKFNLQICIDHELPNHQFTLVYDDQAEFNEEELEHSSKESVLK